MTRTFLFADLRDFTGFVERRGDQAAAELVAAYRALIRRQIEKSAGAEIKVEGDAMFVVFPSAREAIQCGAAILRGAATHSADQPDSPMEIGIGLHAGEPVAQAGDFIGSAVNIAARIAAAASRGQLLISDLVSGLVRTEPPYPVRDLGAVLLKGLSEPVHVFEVLWDQTPRAESQALLDGALLPAPVPPRFPGAAAPLIGRDAELSALRDRLQALEHGRGASVFIAGEAGIGKSRLLRDAFLAAGSGITLYGACGLSDAPPPYEPFAGIIRRILRAPDGEVALRRIAPELLALAPETTGSRQQAPDRDHLFGAMLRVLRQYARVSPLVILIEDLHWADEATLALLQFLFGQAEATPYLLVGTYRSDELHRRHRLRPVLAALARRTDVSTITLDPLPEPASLELLQALPALADAPPSEVSAINHRAEGNPLFLEELAQHHQVGREAVPGSVAETVMERVGRAGSAATRLLRYLAVIGIRADYDLLERVMKDEQAVLEGARASVEQHLVVEEGDALVFRHALTREAVLSDLMTRERRAVHREVGEALEQSHGSEADLSETIAEHLRAAGLHQRALPYLLRAGERALRLHAADEAARAYEQAVESAPPGTRDRMLALDGLGRAYSELLQVGKAYSTFDEALALARTVGTRDDVAGIMMRRTYTMPWGREEYAAWKACWDAAEPLGNAHMLARIASSIARRAQLFFEDDQARAWLERALAEARRSGSPEREIWVLRNRAQFEHKAGWQAEEETLIRGQLDKALSENGEVLELYSDLLSRRARDSDAAERTSMIEAARAYADKRAVPLDLSIRFGVPWMSWLSGDWPAALALWEEIRSRHSEDAPAIYPSAGPIAAAIDLEIHGPAQAGARLRQAVAPMRATETWRGLLNAIGHEANLHLVDGRPETVLDAVRPILENRPPAMLDAETFALTTRAVLPAAFLAQDRGLLSRWTDDPAVAAGGALHRAATDHARAVQAIIKGDLATADEAFVRAANAYLQHGWRLLAHELAWQRIKAGTPTAPSARNAASAFYREVGAAWRLDWLASQ